ncbi:MAG: hypothetical protein ABSH28_04195 [Acidobacteriota bacterium]
MSIASESQPNGNALTWPFYQTHWFFSLCILLVGWFPVPIPMTFTMGWLLDATGRRGRRESTRLPQVRNLGRMY